MTAIDPDSDDFEYREFDLLGENAEEYGLPATFPPVRRASVPLADGRHLSVLVWGSEPPEVVFVHGTGQNAHTWDTVVLALGLPAIAVDLPGHGHSAWRDDRDYTPRNMADDVAEAMRVLSPMPASSSACRSAASSSTPWQPATPTACRPSWSST